MGPRGQSPTDVGVAAEWPGQIPEALGTGHGVRHPGQPLAVVTRGHLGCGGRCAAPPPGSGMHPPTDCTQAHPRLAPAPGIPPAPQGLPSWQGSPQAPPPLVAPRQAPCWLEVRGSPCSYHTPRMHPGPDGLSTRGHPTSTCCLAPGSPGSSRLWASGPLCWSTGTLLWSLSLLSGDTGGQVAPAAALGGGRRPWSRGVLGVLLGQDDPLGRGHVPSASVAGKSCFGIGFLANSLSAATFRAENKAFHKESQ